MVFPANLNPTIFVYGLNKHFVYGLNKARNPEKGFSKDKDSSGRRNSKERNIQFDLP